MTDVNMADVKSRILSSIKTDIDALVSTSNKEMGSQVINAHNSLKQSLDASIASLSVLLMSAVETRLDAELAAMSENSKPSTWHVYKAIKDVDNNVDLSDLHNAMNNEKKFYAIISNAIEKYNDIKELLDEDSVDDIKEKLENYAEFEEKSEKLDNLVSELSDLVRNYE